MPEQLVKAIQDRQWYPVAAIALWYGIALWKKHGAARIGPKIPEGWKWLVPVLTAAAIGFTDGFFSRLDAEGAAWRAAYAVIGLALPAMGWQGALKESPLGGPPGKFSLGLLLLLGLSAPTGCATTPAKPAPAQPATVASSTAPPVRVLGAEEPQRGERFGAVVVQVKVAEGEEYAVICGGHLQMIGGDAGRELLRLDREER
jgi:hypothetical protein